MRYWRIEVVDWGVLWAIGSEVQAEEWRCHKARWEACIARKREVLPEELPPDRQWTRLADLLPKPLNSGKSE